MSKDLKVFLKVIAATTGIFLYSIIYVILKGLILGVEITLDYVDSSSTTVLLTSSIVVLFFHIFNDDRHKE